MDGRCAMSQLLSAWRVCVMYDVIGNRPFLLDPCDPFHNIGGYFDWVEMADMAEVTAKSPRLANVQPL